MKIAYGNSRMDKKWKNSDISWEDFCSRVKTTQRTTETVEEYRKMKKGGCRWLCRRSLKRWQT